MSAEPLVLELPYPPSANGIWRRVKSRTIRSHNYRRYIDAALAVIASATPKRLVGRLAVHITMCAPDYRKRDIDNIQKPTLDALAKGGVYEDDSQVDWLLTERGPVTTGGKVVVKIMRIAKR